MLSAKVMIPCHDVSAMSHQEPERIAMYAVMTVIVEGALDTEEIFTDETMMHQRLAEIESDAADDGYRTDVYVLWHECDRPDTECVCAQYVTDHRPYATFN